jgi:predicted nucleic acid-binding protein
MNPRKGLVLDANILMRAVLGRRVRELLETYEDAASFYTPDVCFTDTRYYLGMVLEKRGRDTATGRAALDELVHRSINTLYYSSAAAGVCV